MEKPDNIWTGICAIFEKITFFIVIAFVALLPILFIPSPFFPVQNIRATFFVGVAVLSLITLILRFIAEGKVSIQKSPAAWVFVVLALFSVVSSYFSTSFNSSFIGDGSELGTSAILLAFAAILLTVPTLFAEKKRIFYFYFAFLFSFVVLAAFHVLRLLAGPDFLSFGVFTTPISTLVGNWNDIAILAGVAAIFSLIGLNAKAFGGVLRTILYVVFPISLLLLVVVNFSIGWVILACVSFLISAWIFFFDRNEDGSRRIPVLAIIMLALSVLFIFAGGYVGTKVSAYFNIFQVEAHPLWSTTISLAKPVIQTSPIFGAGPNRFSFVWQQLKPIGVNNSPFWATPFLFGVGIVPTSLITMGVVGFALYVLFLILYAWKGFGALARMSEKSDLSRFVLSSSFFCSLFLWIVAIAYVPGIVCFTFAALWTALFFGALQSEGMLASSEISSGSNIVSKVLTYSVAGVIGVVSIFVLFQYSEKTLAAAYLQRAQYAQAVEGNQAAAVSYLQKAISFSSSPLLYRSLVSVDLGKLNAIISSASDPKTKPTDALKEQFTNALGATLDAGKLAIAGDPVDFRNWVSVGGVYETLVPIAFPNAYENALGAYSRAQALSPMNPEMFLNLARLEFSHASSTAAKGYISKALTLKNDYVAGIFLLAQIQIAEKDIQGAIKSLDAAASINPNDQTVLYQLGVLTYSAGDYKTAVLALDTAVKINPSFSNARYFLGLAYDKQGKIPEAITQFQEIQKLNPDNADVKAIIENLQAGRPIVPEPPVQKPVVTAPKALPKIVPKAPVKAVPKP